MRQWTPIRRVSSARLEARGPGAVSSTTMRESSWEEELASTRWGPHPSQLEA